MSRSTTAVETKKTGVVKIGDIASALPKPVSLNASAVAAEIVKYNDESLRAEGNALRAEITNEETFGNGAEVIKSITVQLKQLDETRLTHTRPYDTAKEAVITMFGVAKKRLEDAKKTLSTKMTVWQQAEIARRQKEAADERARLAQEAQERADAQAALGDEEGAEQILEEAASTPVAPVKVSTVGIYGARAGTRKTKVGTVRNLDSFLNALSKRREPAIKDFAASIEFSKAALNRLAAQVLNGDIPAIPGFDAEEKTDLDVR